MADGYRIDYEFRQGLTDLGLSCVVRVTNAVLVWPPGVELLPPEPHGGMGRPPVMPVLSNAAYGFLMAQRHGAGSRSRPCASTWASHSHSHSLWSMARTAI